MNDYPTSARETEEQEFLQSVIDSTLPEGWVANYKISRDSAGLSDATASLRDHEWRIFEPGSGDMIIESSFTAYPCPPGFLTITYGNTDAGVLGVYRPRHAVLIPINHPNFASEIRKILKEREPNRYGYT